MNLWTLLLNTFLVFRTKPLRAFLAILGIIFGIGAVIAMMAIGEGGRREILKRIEAMGANLVQVKPLNLSDTEKAKNIQKSQGLRFRDLTLIQELLRLMGRDSEFAYSRKFSPTYGEIIEKIPGLKVIGVSEEFFRLKKIKLVSGRLFQAEDYEKGSPVALFNQAALKALKPGEFKENSSYLLLERSSFLNLGSVRENSQNSKVEPGVYIPYQSLRTRLAANPGYGGIDHLLIPAKDLMDTVAVKRLISNQLVRNHNKIRDYEIIAPYDLLLQASQTQQVLNYVLLCIAAISLLVGGIGIMNIMLANVLERIQEVGLRRAVGARSRDILYQFFMESVFICMTGGFLGLLFGYGLARGISHFAGMSSAFTSSTALMAFGISILVGIIFGSYPAYMATRISPMEALRGQG